MMKHTRRTKTLSVLLSLALLLSLIPGMSLTAYATDEHSHDGWTATETLPTTEGRYYLTADVEISNTWTVSGTTNLCLNGHKITKTGSSGSVICIPSGATLNLYDEDNAGIITGGNMTSYPNLYGGGVRIEGGTLNMYGGNITGNKAYIGGGVYLGTGSFVMQGGTISNNNNPNMPDNGNWSGGGVYVNQGSFTLQDGLISGNIAKYGGGVTVNYKSGAQFTMLGGAIQGNSAIGSSYIARGGGLDIMGPFSMEGGKISGNYTAGTGGAIYCQDDIVISDGEISGNCADESAGGIYLSSYNIAISGNVRIKDNVVGGTLDGDAYTGGTKSNVHINSDRGTINPTGELAETASIGITMKTPGVFTKSSDDIKAKDCKSNFFNDDPYTFIEVQEGSDELQLFRQPVSYLDENGEVQECKVYTPVAADTSSWSNGWYVVNDNIISSLNYLVNYSYSVDGTVNLILRDGATLTAAKGISVTSGNTLNIFVQSTGESTGKLVTTGSDGQAGIGSAAPTSDSQNPQACGTVNIYGGDITATGGKGAAGIGGGARYNSQTSGCAGGTVNIYGGTVTAVAGAADDDKGSSVAIGAGGSAENHGTLTLGDGVKLKTSTDNLTWTHTTDTTTRTRYMRATDQDGPFTITVPASEHGTVTADNEQAEWCETVTLTVTPDDGYVLHTIQYSDGTTATDITTVNDNGNFTFVMPAANVTVTAVFAEADTYTLFYRASGNPEFVKFRMTNSGDGYGMTNSAKLGNIDCWAVQFIGAKGKTTFPIAFSTDGGNWGNLTDRNVVDDIPNDLAEGNAVVIKGEAKAFIVSFLWGDIKEDGSADTGKSKNFLVTNNTTSVSIPDPAKDGYSFLGWDDGKNDLKQSNNGAVDITGISESTIFAARWKLNTCNVTYDLGGGSGSAPAATVNYGSTTTAPANPARSGYAFVRWVVAETTTQQIGGQPRRLSAGSAFDFSKTEIINDLKLKAEWKHVHSYVCLQLGDSVFNGAFNSIINYAPYVHIRICTSMDDYCAEAHSYNALGVCACGAKKPVPTVELTKMVNDAVESTTRVLQNSVVAISAAGTKNGAKFSKWQYYDGADWRNLSTSPYTAFVIPSDLKVKAVYDVPAVRLNVESFMYNGKLAFQFTYSVPNGYTVVDAGLLTGNNSHIGYMDAKQLTANVSGMSDIMFPYIPTTEMPIHYDPSTNDAVAKFGAQKVAQKMFREEAINVSGRSNPIFKKCAVLGKAGSAALAINTSGNNIYYYGMGYVICKNPAGNYVAFMTNAISATKSSPNHSASFTQGLQ